MQAEPGAGSSAGINTIKTALLPPKHAQDARLPFLKGLPNAVHY